MAKSDFQQIEKLFHDALGVPPAQRPAFLDAACAGNPELRAAVEELLRHADAEHQTNDFLASPVADDSALLRLSATFSFRAPDNAPSGPAPLHVPGYDVLEELGRGGMGVVYKVRQTSLKRLVALKMLLPGQATAEMLARFRTEADTLARLQHPNIVAIYDIGEQEGRPYFTMEYVAGPGLARLLAGRPQDIAASARLIETLACTMVTVHEQGILHRDLKPANILLQEDLTQRRKDAKEDKEEKEEKEQVEPALLSSFASLRLCVRSSLVPKITDFGLAKDQAADGKLTQSGLILGTPCYMAPEQARRTAEGIGPGVDVYALGSILYEMLTGRPPFQGETSMETIAQLLHEEPLSPARLRPKLPCDLVTICLKCLEKSPRKRYGGARELAEDLRRFQAGEPIRARPVGPVERAVRWCRRRPLVAALLLICACLAVGLVATVLVYEARLEQHLASAEAKAEVERRQIVQLNIDIGLAALADGDAFLAVLRFTEALRLDEDFSDPEQNHRHCIALALRQCPRLIDVRAQEGTVLCTQRNAEGGQSMAVVGPDRLVRVYDVAIDVSVRPALALDHVPQAGAISPDGRSLATITPSGMALVWDMGTKHSRQLPGQGRQAVRKVTFHPTGSVLLTEHADGAIQAWDLTATPLVPLPWSGTASFMALSDNARWLLTVGIDQEARVWDVAAGKMAARFAVPKQTVSLAAISQDGRRISLLGSDNVVRTRDVKTASWLGHLIRPGKGVSQMVFSPDAERLATLGGDQAMQVWEVRTGDRVAGSRRHEETITHAEFSVDGRLITTNGAGVVQVWDAETGLPVTPPLRHGGPQVATAFWGGGNVVTVVGANGLVSVWELPAVAAVNGDQPAEVLALRPIAELVGLAQVLAAGRIDEKQQWQRLDRDVLLASWKNLQQSH